MTTAEEVSVVGVVCDICLNEYKAHDKIRTIPCLHRFHTRCIDKWLKV
jgi:E3 ubiquitin-protein ligase RNF38/44